MSLVLPIILFLVLIGAVVLMVVGFARTSQPDTIGDRLSQFTERPMTLSELELQQPFSQRVIVPLTKTILNRLGKFGPKQSTERIRTNLQQAGNPGNLTPAMFVGVRIGLAVLLFLIFGFVTFNSTDFFRALLFTAIGAVLGYLLPSIWLGQQIKKRKHNITKQLPDILDLLTISVEAGLAFDAAMQRVTEKADNDLSKEFQRVLTDTRLGRPRRDALKDMATRTGVEDVQTFTAAIIQAEQLGVSISKILRVQADQMRIRRRQRAEEAAQKAPIKMLFPMVFLIFPSLFVVILGPAIPRLMQSLGGLGDN
ncbi:MAG: type II secretion system F family protein [Chloroflexi bacterium AL-W]|nr:type II secretion system F family protein [Chloroflexi bacterium AL-N1]NOK65731.1 type II secretion system F family protein [Chloroflexi bacterium AL-N10]NOK74328.1 type II secretion system F family protein [Chloroflexi bacterium AL-N5]NOK80764.1 type II secretion system F family protein [Chloroflexi bacterium AL-W]NOK88586.1 type II secretion system F family protein [Chloroflexi bacterium AL-N15]